MVPATRVLPAEKRHRGRTVDVPPGENLEIWRVTVQRKLRGTTYTIRVRNPRARSKGVKSLVVDGVRIKGNVVPLPTDGRKDVKVEAIVGA